VVIATFFILEGLAFEIVYFSRNLFQNIATVDTCESSACMRAVLDADDAATLFLD
jgi:hypothetical protein